MSAYDLLLNAYLIYGRVPTAECLLPTALLPECALPSAERLLLSATAEYLLPGSNNRDRCSSRFAG